MDTARRRGNEVLSTLVRDRGHALGAYGYLLTGDVGDAQDLVQDSLVKAFTRVSGIDPQSVEGYVRRVMLTTYVDGYRRRRQWDRVRHLLARGERHDGPADEVDARSDIATGLRLLSPQQRACIVLRYYDDLTVPEISDRLRLAEGTVKRYLSVATARLEDLLGPLAPDTRIAADHVVLIHEGDLR